MLAKPINTKADRDGDEKDQSNSPRFGLRRVQKKPTMEVDKATDLISISLRLRLGAASAERVFDRCSAVAPPCRCLFNSLLCLQPCPSLCFMELASEPLVLLLDFAAEAATSPQVAAFASSTITAALRALNSKRDWVQRSFRKRSRD